MTSWETIFGFSLGGALLALMATGIAISAFIPALGRWSRRYFITLFSLLFICTAFCFLALIVWYDPTMAKEARIVYFLESVSISVPILMPTIFLLHCCDESIKDSLLLKLVSALSGVYLMILIVSQFTNVFYYVTPDNQYVRGPLYALMMLPLVAVMILNTVGVIRRRKKLSRRRYIAFLVYFLPMTATLIIQMFIPDEVLVVFGMALLALVMFVLILSYNVDRYTRQQQEIAHQRAGIMVLQMRPHFICNTMMGIYYLCDQDPEKAKQVTLDFTSYLRKNFAAIASEDTIPFSDELEHTRAYLAVEQAQFDDTLFVSFDTQYTAFRLPPLTLQPIVENAVKHGMKASNAPIHISVAAKKTDTSVEITVEDDGPGFAPVDDNEPHVALNNIRQRLELIGGKLEIKEREGGGTSVTVKIPTDR